MAEQNQRFHLFSQNRYFKKITRCRLGALFPRNEKNVLKLTPTGKYLSKEILQTSGFNARNRTMCNTITLSRNFKYTVNCVNPLYCIDTSGLEIIKIDSYSKCLEKCFIKTQKSNFQRKKLS